MAGKFHENYSISPTKFRWYILLPYFSLSIFFVKGRNNSQFRRVFLKVCNNNNFTNWVHPPLSYSPTFSQKYKRKFPLLPIHRDARFLFTYCTALIICIAFLVSFLYYGMNRPCLLLSSQIAPVTCDTRIARSTHLF